MLFAGAFLAAAGAAFVFAGGAAFVATGFAAGSAFASTQPLRCTLTHDACLPVVKTPASGRTSPRIAPRMDGAERSRMAILPVRCAGNESRAGPRFAPSIQPVKVTYT